MKTVIVEVIRVKPKQKILCTGRIKKIAKKCHVKCRYITPLRSMNTISAINPETEAYRIMCKGKK